MLERVHVENFKCLRDVTVDLGKLTILIGPNDSGKSSFLQVIQSLRDLVRAEFKHIFSGENNFENLVWMRDVARRITFEVRVKSKSAESIGYRTEISAGRHGTIETLRFGDQEIIATKDDGRVSIPGQSDVWLGYFPVAGFAKRPDGQTGRDLAELLSTIYFHFDASKMVEPSVPEPGAQLSPSGHNLAGFLDNLLSAPDRKTFASLEKDLHAAVPTLRGISLPPVSSLAGGKSIHFVLSGDGDLITIPASLASGGALLLTAFLALSYSKTPDLILIEEPENGLHPSRLKLVVDVLRKMTTGELGGRPRQIVLTTHSPLLLNYAKPEEVRVFIRDPETGTQVKPMTDIPDADRMLKEFALGELWYLLGEEKLFQEQPA